MGVPSSDVLNKVGQVPLVMAGLELWLGRSVSEGELKILEEMMTSVIDHGPDSPSAQATISAAKEGKDLIRSVEAGVGKINEQHGGAVEGCGLMLMHQDFDPVEIVSKALAQGKRLPGFGHRIYKDEDPRAVYLEQRMEALGLEGKYFKRARALESELEKQKGTKLVVNIDGAMAGVLCGLGVEPKMMNAFFLWPRVAGLVYQWKQAEGTKG